MPCAHRLGHLNKTNQGQVHPAPNPMQLSWIAALFVDDLGDSAPDVLAGQQRNDIVACQERQGCKAILQISLCVLKQNVGVSYYWMSCIERRYWYKLNRRARPSVFMRRHTSKATHIRATRPTCIVTCTAHALARCCTPSARIPVRSEHPGGRVETPAPPMRRSCGRPPKTPRGTVA